MKQTIYMPFIFLCIMNFSCSNEVDDYSGFEQEIETAAKDTSLITRSFGTEHISYKGGTIMVRDIPVRCEVTIPHTHSLYYNCKSTEISGNWGWYSVHVSNFTTATVVVLENNSFVSRTGRVGNTGIYQEGKPSGPADINWSEVKGQYMITGPKWSTKHGQESDTFTLIGPYLSSNYIKIHWTVSPFYTYGGGTITSGQGTSNVSILFPLPDCGGIVRAHVEPVESPMNSFILEFTVSVN